MKILKFLTLFFSLITLAVQAQPGKKIITLTAEGQPNIKFETTIHNFDTITEGTQATYEFTYTNTGKTPLVITDVKPPCNCTIPVWSKEPLQPGMSAKLKVTYDSKGKPAGPFKKTISVSHNGESMQDFITIEGVIKI